MGKNWQWLHKIPLFICTVTVDFQDFSRQVTLLGQWGTFGTLCQII